MQTDYKTPKASEPACVLDPTVGRPVTEREDLGPRLTPEQRARLISSGPNAGRVRRIGCHECGYGKVLGCWLCGGW